MSRGQGGMSGMPVAIVAAIVFALAGARAAEGDQSLSFAFASQAGSGIYDIEGRVVQIYRVPIEFTVRGLEAERRWGAAVRLPITFGFYDYKASDTLQGEFPDHVGTARFEFRHELGFNIRKSRGDIGLFAVYHRYLKHSRSLQDSSPVAVYSAEPATIPGVDEQTELGVSFGTRPTLAWWKISMPKLGLSYRFGDGISAIRVVFGEIF